MPRPASVSSGRRKPDLKQAEEILDNIIEDDKRAGGIISSVKSLMKLETRDMENVNLTAVVQETIDIVHSDLVRHNIKLLDNFDVIRYLFSGIRSNCSRF